MSKRVVFVALSGALAVAACGAGVALAQTTTGADEAATQEQAVVTASAAESTEDAGVFSPMQADAEEAGAEVEATGTATLSSIKIIDAAETESIHSTKSSKLELDGVSESSEVSVVSDSIQRTTAEGEQVNDAHVSSVGAGYVVLKFQLTGTHTVVLSVDGTERTVQVKVGTKKETGSYLMLYSGQELQLACGIGNAKWSSSSPLVASVDENGVVTSSEVGHATLTAKAGGVTVKCTVESTYKKAYQAVENAYEDLGKLIKYSQSKRMKKGYRDCSSFVARCYWDEVNGRHLTVIGGNSNKKWALPAGDQAQWLSKHNKTVALKKVSTSKLLPGDTYYTCSSYGSGSGWRGINHASFYAGNGVVLDGTGTDGVPGSTVGYRDYSKSNIRYIGRVCAQLELNKSALKLDEGKSATLEASYADGKVSWKSEDESVASVNSKGKVTAKTAGQVKITASSKGETYSCLVTVK